MSSGDGANTLSYTYNHNNERAKLVDGTDVTVYPFDSYQIENGTPKLYLSLGDMTVATVEGATTTYLHTDHLGGTTLTTDSAGAITQTLDYMSYGETRLDIGTNDEDMQYTGYKKDATTGLNYASARYYEPSRGAFISQDPVALALGDAGRLQANHGVSQSALLRDPQLLNAYGYARNNPVKYNDPTGETPAIPAMAVIAVRAALIGVGFGIAEQGIEDGINSVASGEVQVSSGGEYAQSALVGGATGAAGRLGGGIAAVSTFAGGTYATNLANGHDAPVADAAFETTLYLTGARYVDTLRQVPGRDVSTFSTNFFTGAHTQEALRNAAVEAGITGAGQATAAATGVYLDSQGGSVTYYESEMQTSESTPQRIEKRERRQKTNRGGR